MFEQQKGCSPLTFGDADLAPADFLCTAKPLPIRYFPCSQAQQWVALIAGNWHSVSCEAMALRGPVGPWSSGNRLRLPASAGTWAHWVPQSFNRSEEHTSELQSL